MQMDVVTKEMPKSTNTRIEDSTNHKKTHKTARKIIISHIKSLWGFFIGKKTIISLGSAG